MSIQSINPYNEQLIREFEEWTSRDIEKGLEQAWKAFLSWRNTSFAARADLMMACAGVLEEKQEELSRVITDEMGKIKTESMAEIKKCAWVCRYYAENAEEFLRDEKLPVEEADSYIAYDPLGVVLAVMPWNFPFWQVFRFAAPNIMAGNAGVLKHASNVPQCALAIEHVFREAGFPEYVFQSFLVGSSKVNDIIGDDRIKAVTLTGSDLAGRKVAEHAGRNLKKLVLELGGSDPFIVLKDAALDQAIPAAVKARMINCGQSCIAAKRFILEESIATEFLNRFQEEFESLVIGDPWQEGTAVGPMARGDLMDDLDHQLENSVKKGARRVTGGRMIEREGFFYQPAILDNVKPGMPAFDEELFGPVAVVTTVKSEKEAVEMGNRSVFGLGASLWTSDIEKANHLARQIESGSVFVNAMVASHPKVPFGGIKSSGYGRELSYVGIREFMNLKSVWIAK